MKVIEVVPYNPIWPTLFNLESISLKEVLGENCIAVHHVGSTSVPGLAAKPKIDIIVVVESTHKIYSGLENIGYESRGEYNIPFHCGFSKRTSQYKVNLHVYEEGNPEIELNLLFRDYLRNHSEACKEYAALKFNLIKHPSSHEKNGMRLSGYNLGKDHFIKKILKTSGFNALCLRFCTHYEEWEAAKKFRQHYFFDGAGIVDPYTWTFDHKEHVHFIFYQGVEIVGYAHIQFWEDQRAALRILIIDEPYRDHGIGSHFLQLCERWLKKQGIHSVHDEARVDAVKFYRKNGYIEMPFKDPSGEPPSAQDVAMGKNL